MRNNSTWHIWSMVRKFPASHSYWVIRGGSRSVREHKLNTYPQKLKNAEVLFSKCWEEEIPNIQNIFMKRKNMEFNTGQFVLGFLCFDLIPVVQMSNYSCGPFQTKPIWALSVVMCLLLSEVGHLSLSFLCSSLFCDGSTPVTEGTVLVSQGA